MQTVTLKDPAGKAVRTVVRTYLDDAVRAAERLSDPRDEEALHDVRVALRRLRVGLKAYAAVLSPGVPAGLRKAIKALAAPTGSARDAEVFIEWVGRKVARLSPHERVCATWLMEKAATRRDAAYRMLRRFVPRAIAMIEPLLRAGLAATAPARESGRGGRTFGSVTARCVRRQLDDLAAALGKIEGPSDDAAAHRARIAAKKVRYLLEPAITRQGRAMIKVMKTLQDALGEFHDLACVPAQVRISRRGRGRGPMDAPTPERLAAIPRMLAIADREHAALYRRIRRDFLLRPGAWLLPVRRWAQRHEMAVSTPAQRMGGADILATAHQATSRARKRGQSGRCPTPTGDSQPPSSPQP